MTIKRSLDFGKNWEVFKNIYAGPSGYSQLTTLNDNELGLLFECGKWVLKIPSVLQGSIKKSLTIKNK